MNPEEHGQESAPPPPLPDAAQKSLMLGSHRHSEATDSNAVASSSDVSAQGSANQVPPATRLDLQRFPEPSPGNRHPPMRDNKVLKGDSASSAEAGGQLTAVPDLQASEKLFAREPGDVSSLPASSPPVASGPSRTARPDLKSETDVPVPPLDPKPLAAQVAGSPRHILLATEISLDGEARRRVSERCRDRRTRSELHDFPEGAKPDWLDGLFRRTGRILIERSPPSDTDPRGQAWFIGDVHGDLVGLLAALDFIHHHSEYEKEDIIVLLGDLIDDLPESEAVLAEVSERLDNGERLIVIVGNHDDALKYIENRGFGASVDPCDYCEELKRIADSGPEHRSLVFARSFIRYMSDAPVALFLNDGTMAAHGGVPHTDLAEKVSRGGWGEDPDVLSDFIWARLHPRAKSRMAVTGTRSRELGADDFRQFASAVKVNLDFEPVRMIRGHDHIDARFEIYGGKWRDTVLTINNMSWKLPREAGVDGPRNPCIARWNRGKPIQPIVILMDSPWRKSMQLGSPE